MRTGRHLYEFAPYSLDPAERRLLRHGEPVPLTPKCFDLLVVLVENSGRLLEKSDLLARIWPNQFVEEGSLTFNISELRKALGEGQNGSLYIETIRKKGFRFVAPVRDIAEPPGAEVADQAPRVRASRRSRIAFTIAVFVALLLPAWALWRARSLPIDAPLKTIAVLPFKPLAPNLRDEPLEIGICNALIVRLASLEQLVVRPTSSVAAYTGLRQDPVAAGRALGADAVVDGYIEKSRDRLRVTARLIRTADGKSLWSGQFNESFTDIFAVEDSISSGIVEALHLNLKKDDRHRVTKHSTENAGAYELYLKGRYFQDKRTAEGLGRSIDYFQQAAAKDPHDAMAFVGLSESYAVLATRADAPPGVAYEKSRAAAMRALEIDDTIAAAHSALGNVKSWYDWDWPGAEREFKRAVELSANDPAPNTQYASYLLAVGRSQEAISEIARAQRLAPVSLTTNVQAARILFFAGQYESSLAQCQKTIDMAPDFGGAYIFVGRIYTQEGRYREAFDALDRARTLLRDSAEVLSLIGYADAVSGRKAEAEQMLKELHAMAKQRYVSPYHFAMIHAGLGDRDQALAWLERAYGDREGRMTIVRLAPEFAALRSDPRFIGLMQRMKLVV